MTFLQLVQRFRQETNYANTGPTTVLSQTGDHARAVSWVDDAYRELQNRHFWDWLRKDFTLAASSGNDTYDYTSATDVPTSTAISRFKAWAITDHRNPPLCYLTASGSNASYWLTYIPWEEFRTVYKIGNQTDAAPAHITIDPSHNIVLGPQPGDSYTITGEYHRSAQSLAADGTVPEMPTDYHMAIVYKAMEDGGYFDAADEILARALKKGRKLIRQLESVRFPTMRQSGPMA